MRRLTFRPAKPAPSWWNLVKTLLQTSFFWLVFLAALPGLIFALEITAKTSHFSFPAQALISWGVFALASCLGLWSGVTMALRGRGTPLPTDAARRLVVSGPYRFVRNPKAMHIVFAVSCVWP